MNKGRGESLSQLITNGECKMDKRKICESCGDDFLADDEEYYCCEQCEREANGEDDSEDD